MKSPISANASIAGDRLVHLAPRDSEDRAVQVDVLAAGELRVEAAAELEQRGDAPARAHAARRRRQRAGDQLQQRRLARAVAADETDGLAARDARASRRTAPRTRDRTCAGRAASSATAADTDARRSRSACRARALRCAIGIGVRPAAHRARIGDRSDDIGEALARPLEPDEAEISDGERHERVDAQRERSPGIAPSISTRRACSTGTVSGLASTSARSGPLSASSG